MKAVSFIYVIAGVFFLAPLASHSQANLPQLGKNSISEVVKAMTLEEKVNLVVGRGFSFTGVFSAKFPGDSTKDRVEGQAGNTLAIPRLGVPSVNCSDGPAGVRIDPVRKNKPGKTYYATAWPVGTLLASSWDTALVKKVGAAFGGEVKEYGMDIILGPGMNIQRNPLGGRNFEYYSEDPLVSGKIAAAIVKGLQSKGVGTSIKHFAANNQETNRATINTLVSERALREIYLRGFEIAVKDAHPWTIMSSYNLINGTYTSESHDLLTTILRDDWGYKGMVMTDWTGGKDPVAQMKAGNDLLMPGDPKQVKAILDAVQNGTLATSVLDKNAARILRLVLKSPAFKGYRYSDQPNLKADAQLSREAASQGMVLLKNNADALPLKQKDRNLAVFGVNALVLIAGGTGSGDVNKAYKISLVQGLKNAGYTVDADVENGFKSYVTDYSKDHPTKNMMEEYLNPSPPMPEFVPSQDLISSKASADDLAIISIGRIAGEGTDRKVPGNFEFTSAEENLIKTVSDAFHANNKKVVVVLNIGGAVKVTSWRDKADAILLAWQPGQEGGDAIADVLSGKVNPSGKLAASFPDAYNDVPSAKTFPGTEHPEQATTGAMGFKMTPAEITYDDGIYVGYRYFNSFHIKPAYPFGFGMSYTQFKYGGLKLSATAFSKILTASVVITNTGKVPGKEVVQLYLSAPRKELDKPLEELKAFAKTRLLQPGESQTLAFTLRPRDLASFNTGFSAWVADSGKYELKIGASSEDIKLTKTFTLAQTLTVQKVHKALAPQAGIDELKNRQN